MKTLLEQADKYLNLRRKKAERDYGFTYLAWLKNGCIGHEPVHSGLSYQTAQAIRKHLDLILVNPLDIAPQGRR